MLLSSLVVLCTALSSVQAVTVYGQIPLAQTATQDSAAPAATTLAAYNTTRLNPPPVPNPPPPRAYTLQVPQNAADVAGISIPHVGSGFWGFSIEMSVISQVLGRNSSLLQVPFLNLMANLQERAGGVVVRLGGNTQEFAVMVPSSELEEGHTFGKRDSGSTQTTKTPAVLYTIDMFYMASNISSMLNVKWFFGIPFNDSVNWRLAIAEEAQTILGDNLLALQAGNEPDFYAEFGRRVAPYEPIDYSNEVANLITVMDANPRITNKHMLLGPSVATGPWTPEMVWDTGFMDRFKDRMYAFTVENYPDNNCAAQFNNGGTIRIPQDVFPNYLDHQKVVARVTNYYNSGLLAQQAGRPLYMFETNTASCGGFAGVSDTYGAALWAMDYGFQMAYGNFTHAMLHVGGQNVFYNPFTAPPTNQSSYNQWSVGAVYYSAIVLAEAFGKTNTSRIIDTGGNNGNIFTPSYAIYENGVLNKLALFNYVDDPSGASALQVAVPAPPGGGTTVRVKYLAAESVAVKGNITWAGQTLGNQLEADGRFRGDLSISTIQCQSTTCTIPVPAPGFALVFYDTAAPQLSVGQASQTFATSARTRVHNTATVDLAALATSNGHSGMSRGGFGSTSVGSVSSARRGVQMGMGVGVQVGAVVGAVVGGAVWVGRVLVL